jgi:hypothetical protein
MSTTDKPQGFATLAEAVAEIKRRREAEARKQAQGQVLPHTIRRQSRALRRPGSVGRARMPQSYINRFTTPSAFVVDDPSCRERASAARQVVSRVRPARTESGALPALAFSTPCAPQKGIGLWPGM